MYRNPKTTQQHLDYSCKAQVLVFFGMSFGPRSPNAAAIIPRCSDTSVALPYTYLGDVLVIFVKGLPILPVIKCSHSHNVFFLVNDRKGQDVFNDPASFIYRSFL